MGYLDTSGLSHFWGTVKAALLGKQDKLTPDGSITLQGGGIGVKTPVKPVTRAEYDAFTEEEKQADAVYLVDEPPWTPVPLSIQEYDTEDGWHVRKWSDGYVEMSCKIDTIIPEKSTITLLDIGKKLYPIELKELYGVSIQALGCGYYTNVGDTDLNPAETTIDDFLKYTPSIGLYTPISTTYVRQGIITVLTTGRWK